MEQNEIYYQILENRGYGSIKWVCSCKCHIALRQVVWTSGNNGLNQQKLINNNFNSYFYMLNEFIRFLHNPCVIMLMWTKQVKKFQICKILFFRSMSNLPFKLNISSINIIIFFRWWRHSRVRHVICERVLILIFYPYIKLLLNNLNQRQCLCCKELFLLNGDY